MVFERLGLSLYDFLLKNHYTPFDVNDVRDFAFQLLDAVGCKFYTMKFLISTHVLSRAIELK